LAILHIFGDESGTMPVNDDDKPLVAATVTFLDKTPAAVRGSDEDETLISIFKDLNVIPFAATVKPFPGYGKVLKGKHDKIQVMARVLFSGLNRPKIYH
jgi:hypothetical protein